MKFNYGFILALLAASASAKVIEPDLSSLAAGGIENASPEAIQCTATMTLYSSCAQSLSERISTLDITSMCATYEGDTCKDFISNIDKQDANCAKAMPEVNVLIDTLRYFYFTACIKDEKGELCPYQKTISEETAKKSINAEENVTLDDKVLEKAIDDSCYSEKCVNGIKKSFEIIDSLGGASSEMNVLDSKSIENFKTKVNNCKVSATKAPENTTDASSASRLVQWSGLYLLGVLSLYFMNFY